MTSKTIIILIIKNYQLSKPDYPGETLMVHQRHQLSVIGWRQQIALTELRIREIKAKIGTGT
ncbi:hypothetical protein [cyanobacterium endosymbiont of Epithemia clementina EcSB]|uniref:hypothetical protein n=1 Tax=cyanobacterium endosymbiont of Epithemia clementina EcSB TaxID=3034674 RepID=UPI00315D59A2